MLMKIPRVVSFLLLVSATGCSSPTGQACTFSYDEMIKGRIAKPSVTRGFGAERAAYYNFDRPVITRKGNSVTLLFWLDDKKLWEESRTVVVDPPHWGIDIDACSLEVIASYEVSGTVISQR
jgi:hypothetical protein